MLKCNGSVCNEGKKGLLVPVKCMSVMSTVTGVVAVAVVVVHDIVAHGSFCTVQCRMDKLSVQFSIRDTFLRQRDIFSLMSRLVYTYSSINSYS